MEEACKNCVFSDKTRFSVKGHTLCRRFPPGGDTNTFPIIHEDDWCGEFKEDVVNKEKAAA
ncbi:hypothetical protein SAMN05428952_100914 [Nitrosomonas sp. Nm132]|jgi:hypothetical protein|nr:hypothetical protein SAMN05428952_100914 [Nitrosomonas sp. Nm132]